MKQAVFTIVIFSVSLLSANNPGAHMVQLSWTYSGPTATFNIYRGTATGVCSGHPTPYANVSTTSFEDDNVTPGTTYFYAVTAFPATGGESTCTAEVQSAVQSSQAPVPAVPSGQAH